MLPDGRIATASSAEFEGFTGVVPSEVAAGVRGQTGHLVLVGPGGAREIGADISAPEFATDPDGEGTVSNPYGVTAVGSARYVSDSAANDVLAVNGGVASVLTTLPHAGADQSDPDALTAGPDGALYVGEFTGGSQVPGAARIWRVVPGQPPAVFAGGLTSITALAFGPDGTRTVLALHHLHYPGGIAVAPDGTVFVSDWTVAGAVPVRHGELKGQTARIVRLR